MSDEATRESMSIAEKIERYREEVPPEAHEVYDGLIFGRGSYPPHAAAAAITYQTSPLTLAGVSEAFHVGKRTVSEIVDGLDEEHRHTLEDIAPAHAPRLTIAEIIGVIADELGWEEGVHYRAEHVLRPGWLSLYAHFGAGRNGGDD